MAGPTFRLTRVEQAFLLANDIPQNYVADMRHRADWASCSAELRAVGCFFAWGFRKCATGHRLTNSRGQCIQCHSATIAFVMRHARPGWLYIAVADCEQLIKVGIGADVDARLRQLNAHRLAGVRRWQAVHTDWCENPAALEAEVHRRLATFRAACSYDRKGGQIGREVFACSPADAISALAEIYSDKPLW
ncbi:MAG: GIY-YIG nuclease family protein [Sphingomonadales bacterium]|nr:MAG: GIY-YIG nuclease family protein [Sphingomonadales bacterium]